MPTSYSDRVMAFRRGVYACRDRLTPGCQVLLLRLSDDMNANAVVSVPRSQLAGEFGCPPPRITEWIKQAKAAGFLDTVRRGRPGVTAVYQGLRGDLVREGVPSHLVRITKPREVREGVPPNRTQRYARHIPQEVVASGTVRGGPDRDVGSDDKAGGPTALPASERSA